MIGIRNVGQLFYRWLTNDKIVKSLRGYKLLSFVTEEEFVKGKATATLTYLSLQHLSPEKNPSGIRVDLAYGHAQMVCQLTV